MDATSTPYERDDGRVRTALVALGLAAFGVLVPQLTVLPAVLVDSALLESPGEASLEGRTLLMILNFVGFALAGALYLAVTDRGWSYVDLAVPTKRDWLYVLGGIVGSFLFYLLVSVLIQFLSLPAAENQVLEYIAGDQTMILVMIVIVFFFNAPAEEFLFRNIVQKRLYAAFGRLRSVAIASVIFALVHFPVYAALADSTLATVVSLSIVFGGAVIFGYLYARTDNLVVPIAAHAAFNALQFGLLYLAIEFDLEGTETAPSLFAAVAGLGPL